MLLVWENPMFQWFPLLVFIEKTCLTAHCLHAVFYFYFFVCSQPFTDYLKSWKQDINDAYLASVISQSNFHVWRRRCWQEKVNIVDSKKRNVQLKQVAKYTNRNSKWHLSARVRIINKFKDRNSNTYILRSRSSIWKH